MRRLEKRDTETDLNYTERTFNAARFQRAPFQKRYRALVRKDNSSGQR
uniref:Uncharacterized protein n=1 Tax=Anguilla anguilla TaxID=7936 RepID=A0A0E9V6L2_ANGAN